MFATDDDQCNANPLHTNENESNMQKFNGKKFAFLKADDMIGEECDSLEEATMFYFKYSKIIGFGVQKFHIKKFSNGEIRKIVWACDKQGYRNVIWLYKKNRKRVPKPLVRGGCSALFGVVKNKDSSKWIVTKFIPEHSHQLLSSHEIRCLRSNLSIKEPCLTQAKAMYNVGIGTTKIMNFMVDQADGYDNISFQWTDLHNTFIREKILGIQVTDSETLIAHFRTNAEMDPDLYFRYTVNLDNRLANMFWVDSAARFDYSCFRDVLAFDARYKTNTYGLPIVILVGVNNHSKTIIFGMTLVVDEMVETYTWVLKTFFDAMNNKHPRPVVTYGDKVMHKAIQNVFPNSYHHLCKWHIERNAQANLHDANVVRAFTDCLVGEYSEQEFEHRWMCMVENFSFHNNAWLMKMHETRSLWAEAYMKGQFFTGMQSTERYESINVVINRNLHGQQKLYEFIISIDRVVSKMRNEEVNDDIKSKCTTPVLLTPLNQIEKHASEVYIRKMFKKVRDLIKKEVALIKTACTVYGDRHIYTLIKFMHPEAQWIVMYYFNQNLIKCTCNTFDRAGIPCSHAFYIMKEASSTNSRIINSKALDEGCKDKYRE